MIFKALRDLGLFGTNCYILSGDEKNAVIIDAPYSAQRIIRELDALDLTLRSVYFTHGHCDHIEALGGLYQKYSCEVYIHQNDADMLTDIDKSLAGYFGTPFEPFYGAKLLLGGEEITDCGLNIKVIATPGHSAGSVCYITKERIFSGDTIFENSIGRTDLGGDYDELMDSIDKMIMTCDLSLPVFPGHGMPTSLYEEYIHSPWLAELRKKGSAN